MTLILCADDRGGLAFHRRRQSRDRTVCADLMSDGAGRLIWMEPYSRPLFPEAAPNLRTAAQPWTQAGPEDLCFLERADPAPALERAEALIVYRWNRHYPSDLRISLPPQGWSLATQREFPGYSHDTITKEVYTR